MATVVLESLGIQLGCQAIGPTLRMLFKYIRKMAKAYPQAKEFWKKFKRQYELFRFAGTNADHICFKTIKDVAVEAEALFLKHAEKVEGVLGKNYTWRIRWAIVSKSCKEASEKIGMLNDELLRVERVIRLEYEKERLQRIITGALTGGVLGAFGGVLVVGLGAGAVLGGALAGAIIGAAVGWIWS